MEPSIVMRWWWGLATVVVSLAVSQGSAKLADDLPIVDRLDHYEPLTYDTRPLADKHERIARNVIWEHQIRNLRLKFQAYNRIFDVRLRPSRSVLASGVRFTVNGKPTISTYDPTSYYEGELDGDPSSHVTGHVIEGVFSGVIKTSDGTYHVEKTRKHFSNYIDLPFHSFIYHQREVQIPDHPAGCGVNGTAWRQLQELQSTAPPLNNEHDFNKRSTETLTELFSDQRRRNKRAITTSGGLFCHMLVAVDHLFFSQIGGGNEQDSFAEVVTAFNQVQDIFNNTDFDGDEVKDSIRPSIAQFDILDQNDPNYRFGDTSISVNDFLDRWSTDDHTAFCLALLLTNRDFDDGVLGLAWVAQPPGGNRGGICEGRVPLSVGQRSLNTAIVTFTNFGRVQPREVSVVTIAHELGHNFGAPHDPQTSRCSPGGGGGGNFIMFPQATNGEQTNNKKFSPCSREDIRDVLQSTKSMCFADGAFCGNEILEDGEDCDGDPCCNNNNCTLKSTASCSSQQDCCHDNCTVRMDMMTCREATECALAAVCNGTSGGCPPSVPRESAGPITCNNGSNVCDENGLCVGSYCLRFSSLGECQCDAKNIDDGRLCEVCCLYRGKCNSTFDLVSEQRGDNTLNGIEGQLLEPGRSCDNFQGYCSQRDSTGVSTCVVVDNEQTLNDLLDLLSIETLNDIVAWLTVYWWIAIIVIIAFLVLFILLQVTYRKRAPLKRRLTRARNSFRRNSTEGGGASGRGQVRGDGAAAGGGRGGGGGRGERARRRRENGRRQISPDDAVKRLSAFFPTSQAEVVHDVIRHSQSESKAVKRMLELGFPMKKIPIPRA